mmetsp:Transcript_29428/g.44547  ORF Transcript_29428/g.44547 Transcript_29428/m.44547 type:complete len:229 (+) Transcript_29428:1138-1824(+)
MGESVYCILVILLPLQLLRLLVLNPRSLVNANLLLVSDHLSELVQLVFQGLVLDGQLILLLDLTGAIQDSSIELVLHPLVLVLEGLSLLLDQLQFVLHALRFSQLVQKLFNLLLLQVNGSVPSEDLDLEFLHLREELEDLLILLLQIQVKLHHSIFQSSNLPLGLLGQINVTELRLLLEHRVLIEVVVSVAVDVRIFFLQTFTERGLVAFKFFYSMFSIGRYLTPSLL